MINTVTLIGNICHDLELRKTQSGKSVLSFTVASNNGKGKDANDLAADFIPCQAWEKTAEIISQYCHKGSKVGISGQIKSYTKTDDQNKNRTFIFVRVERIMLLDAKPASQPVQPQTQPVYQPQEAPAPAQATYQSGYNPSLRRYSVGRACRFEEMTDEGRLKAAITKTLERRGYLVLRLQSGMFKTFDGRIVRVGVKGLPDLLAIDGDSRVAFIELKRPGRSKIYQCQLDYIEMLQKRGIRAGIARSQKKPW